MYKEVWEAAIGEVLECHREPTNVSFHVLDRSKNFRCIIIFVPKIFIRFQRPKIFLRRKKQITVVRSCSSFLYMCRFMGVLILDEKFIL